MQHLSRTKVGGHCPTSVKVGEHVPLLPPPSPSSRASADMTKKATVFVTPQWVATRRAKLIGVQFPSPYRSYCNSPVCYRLRYAPNYQLYYNHLFVYYYVKTRNKKLRKLFPLNCEVSVLLSYCENIILRCLAVQKFVQKSDIVDRSSRF